MAVEIRHGAPAPSLFAKTEAWACFRVIQRAAVHNPVWRSPTGESAILRIFPANSRDDCCACPDSISIWRDAYSVLWDHVLMNRDALRLSRDIASASCDRVVRLARCLPPQRSAADFSGGARNERQRSPSLPATNGSRLVKACLVSHDLREPLALQPGHQILPISHMDAGRFEDRRLACDPEPHLDALVVAEPLMMRMEKGKARRFIEMGVGHHPVDVALGLASSPIIDAGGNLVSMTWATLPARQIRMSGLVWKAARSSSSKVSRKNRPPCK